VLNPRLVYTSISAFGRRGPKASHLGYEALVQAYSGVMAMTGEPDGDPVRCGVSFLDMATGVMSALATVTALLRRAQTGEGSRIDASLLETSLGLQTNQFTNYLMHGIVPRRLGTAHPQVVPYQAYRTADGYVFIATGNQNLFTRFCRAVAREDLLEDPRFRNNAARVEHREACLAEVCGTLEAMETEPLMAVLTEHGVPFTRVNEYPTLIEDGQVDALRLIASGPDPDYGEFRIPGLPFTLSGHDRTRAATAPRLGEHTEEVLRSLGYDEARIAALYEQGAVRSREGS
jgi:formyl-CoA transferase/CoA:oxalate CoA-transferase